MNGLTFDGAGAYVSPRPCVTALTGVPPAIAAALDPALLDFETWLGDETGSRSARQYVATQSGGAVHTLSFPAPDAGDTITRGVCESVLAADPVAVKGALRRQGTRRFAVDGFGATRKTFWGHRFRMQSLIPDGANYEINGGGLANMTGTGTNNYLDGLFMFFDHTLGVPSWVLRCARAGVPVDIDLGLAWDNAYHTVGFLHRGDDVQAFVDGEVVDAEDGVTIQPATAVGPVAYHIVSAAAGTDNGTIQSDWTAWGPSR